jgi:short-subunit dehydrogenase
MQKTILITGCSSGIGLSTCHFLKNRGYRVFATARKPEDVATLQGNGFESFQLDVNSSEQIKQVITRITQITGGTLYALCNNAGYAQPGALEDISRESLRQQFETNVFGLQEMTNAVLPIMRQQGYGRIIHISSVLGLISLPFRGAYNASKYAVEGLADTLRLEVRKTKIYISLIEPGPVDSYFRENALFAYQHNIQPEKSAFERDYRQFLINFGKNKAKAHFSAKPEAVANKIYNALESNKPKPRYFVTAPTYIFATLKRLLPQRWMDGVLAMIANQEIH